MAGAIDYKDGIGRKDLRIIHERFLDIHKLRLKRIQGELRPAQQVFIELLPLLFHINHPLLPGFVSSDTPAGIPRYTPTREVILAAKSVCRSFKQAKKAQRRSDILGLYLMGSIGSIGHTAGSDFDVWLCHEPTLGQAEIAALRQKAEKLEAWAAELALEVHFFLINVATFREGKRDALSHESSGSSQPRLLLEEFYRTAVLLAGRPPLWWFIPPEEDIHYSEYARMLLRKRFVDAADCLDFGGLETLPASEFFGAAHWQLYKGIQSPYKSILKLLLTESYAQDFPHIRWLCQETKKAVYAGVSDTAELDPYVLMYRRVEHYLLQGNHLKRLDLARRCFYFKTGLRLSRAGHAKQERWQVQLMRGLIEEWGWSQAKLISLDHRSNWSINDVQEERNILVRELTHSYRLLTAFSRIHGKGQGIDPKELSLLGRKLYTALEKRPGKIEYINPGITRSLVEGHITLCFDRSEGDDTPRWQLYLGNIGEHEVEAAQPVKTTPSLIEMLTWCHINGVIDRGTLYNLYPRSCPVGQEELHALIDTIRRAFPHHKEPLDIPIDQLMGQPYVTRCLLFPNIGTDPMDHFAKEGKQLTSNRSDPLSYGAARQSLVANIEQLIHTSWGETLVLRHRGINGMLECLCDYLRLSLTARPDQVAAKALAFSFSSARASGIAKRVQQLFNDVSHSLGPEGVGNAGRYLLQAEDNYYFIHYRENDGYSFYSVNSWHELLDILSLPNAGYRPVIIDRFALRDTPLPIIYQANQPDLIQVFYTVDREQSNIFVLDENGALFHQRLQGTDEHYLVAQQQRFFNGLTHLHSLLTDSPSNPHLLDGPEFYRLDKDPDGRFTLQKRRLSAGRLPGNYLELKAITSGLELNLSPFVLVCGEEEFNSQELGQGIYEAVARYVVSRRKSGQTYPIYLTNLELSGSAAQRNWSTIEMLKYKKRLEGRLNQALRQLTA